MNSLRDETVGIVRRVQMKIGHPFKGTVTDVAVSESGHHSYWVRWDDGSEEQGPFGYDDIAPLPGYRVPGLEPR